MRKSKTLLLILIVLTASTPGSAQGRSPLLDKIISSIEKHQPLWYFIPGVCTCPALVPNQLSHAMGGWHLGGLASKRDVTIYISYVPSVEDAAEWMEGLTKWNVAEGWHRDRYPLGDESYLSSADDGYSYLYFRKGSVVLEVSGEDSDVKLFAKYAEEQMRAD